MKETDIMVETYVFGHKSPDSDTITSSIVMANLEKELGNADAKAYRLGNINKETEFILNYLNMDAPELLDDVVSYIESHLHEKISLADTASRFYVSESTIGQTFQKKMHMSFYHYVTQRRLIAAKSMILEEANLDTLSEKVGFTDYSTFYRAFKKEFGISPREYRNLIAETPQTLL